VAPAGPTAQDASPLTPSRRSRTVAAWRAPARGAREGHDPATNPLLWMLGRYRLVRGRPCSRNVVEHFVFGLLLSGLALFLSIAFPERFALSDFNFIAIVLAGAHILWLTTRLAARLKRWTTGTFLDQVLVTALKPHEIAGAIAQSAARPIFACFAGSFTPLLALEWFQRLTANGRSSLAVPAVWTLAAPFIALAIFMVPWSLMWRAWKPAGAGRPVWPLALAAAWGFAVPAVAVAWHPVLSFAVEGLLLFATLACAMHVAGNVPELLALRA